jgi:hypothetical protein
MRYISLAVACVAVAGAISAAVASVSYASSSGFERALATPLLAPTPRPPPKGSLFDKEIGVFMAEGISPERAVQALDVQNRVARTGFVRKVEAGTGSAFAGVWFDPAAAQLYVGATSPESRRAAEEVIAREGFAADVVIMPVRSTTAELLAAQGQWDRKLAKLSVDSGVSTAIEPQYNAVAVRLDSSVSPSELAVLKREAAAADVNVLVSVAHGRLGVTPRAKTECKTWKTFEAFCNPSITPGVTIAGKLIECKEFAAEFLTGFATKAECENRAISWAGKKGKWDRILPVCTAGPVAINSKKERVLMTAGHCIGKAAESWSSATKGGVESVIGAAGTFVFGGPKKEEQGDYAEVGIEPAWQTGKPRNPVLAVTAEWKKMNEKKEETSYPVKGENTPAVGMISCHVGQTTGESCGQVHAVNVKATFVVGGVEKIVIGLVEVIEVKKEPLEVEGGDSGGPDLTIEEPSQEALMEGTLTGEFFECNEVAEDEGPRFYKTEKECKERVNGGKGKWEAKKLSMIFQPLRSVEGGPEGSLEKLKLTLLTKANEVIPGPVWVTCLPKSGAGHWEDSHCTKGKTNGGWETSELTTTVEVTSSGELELEDSAATGGAVKIVCKESNTGTVGAEGSDSIVSLTTTGCKFVESKHGACEEAGTLTAAAVNLGWSTSLEEKGSEVRDAFTSLVSGKKPGWSVSCRVGGILKVADECTGNITAAVKANRAEGSVEGDFEKESPSASCTLGNSTSGHIEGKITSKLRMSNGELLSFWILAPALKT